MLEKVHRIQDAGMEVWCGMIIGFDNDDRDDLRPPDRVRPGRRGSPFSMSGMLTAIPKTPLYDRLLEEGRLDLSDPPECGTKLVFCPFSTVTQAAPRLKARPPGTGVRVLKRPLRTRDHLTAHHL